MHSETLLSLFLPVLPTLLRSSYPFCQRRCAATASQSGRTICSYPTGQAERKAARKTLPHLSHLNARKYKVSCQGNFAMPVTNAFQYLKSSLSAVGSTLTNKPRHDHGNKYVQSCLQ